MMLRTHLAFAVLLCIIFFNYVNNPWIFVGMVLVATVLPDLDSVGSEWGRHSIFRPIQAMTKHRGVFHSFSFAILFSVLIAIFWPVGSLGFFLGYSVHLICDSFTKRGIRPFWPLKETSRGLLHSGGIIEETLFFSLIVLDLILFGIIFIIDYI